MLEEAIRLHQDGRFDEAIPLYRAALASTPENFETHHFLGMALHQSGLTEDAIAAIERALEIRPDYAQAHLNLGRILIAGGHREAGGLAFSRALRIEPENVEILATNGVFAMETGRDVDAVALLRRTVELAPSHTEARTHLARMLLQLHYPVEALETIASAIDADPHSLQALLIQAKALYRLGQLDDARGMLDRIDDIAKPFPEAMFLRAQMAEETGHFEAAKEWYLQTLRHLPEHAGALAGLIGLRSAAEAAAPFIDAATRVAYSEASAPDQRRTLLHALGKYHDRARSFDRAFDNFTRANALVSSATPYDPEAHEDLVDGLIAIFDEPFFAARRDWGLPGAEPIFVIGMPRSGTTLTEQILAAHPQVAGAGEMGWFPNLSRALLKEAGAEGHLGAVRLLGKKQSVVLAERYLDAQKQAVKGDGADRIVDKLPLNFLHVDLIRTLFPNASIIACLRDPMDNCLSCFMEGFDEDYAFAADLAHLGHFYRQHERLISHWSHVTQVFHRSYQDVIRSFEPTTRSLLQACRLPWDDRCLHYNQSHVSVRTPSKWQVRQPIYRTSVERWRNYEAHLGPLRVALGDQVARRG